MSEDEYAHANIGGLQLAGLIAPKMPDRLIYHIERGSMARFFSDVKPLRIEMSTNESIEKHVRFHEVVKRDGHPEFQLGDCSSNGVEQFLWIIHRSRVEWDNPLPISVPLSRGKSTYNKLIASFDKYKIPYILT